MSFDLNLTTLCDHRIFRELTVIDTDFKTIRLESPMGSTNNVIIYVTDNLLPSNLYEIVDDPDQIDVNRAKMIVFKDKWRSPSDYFEVTYNTIPSYCTKCVGSNYLDDLSYNVRGELLEQRNERLLMQNVEKFVVTRINSNPFQTFIGTGLVGLIGSRITNVNFLITQITSEISRTLQKLQDLQSQYQLTGRTLTSGEILQSVDDISVIQDVNDPTVLRATVKVTAQSGQSVEFTQVLKLRT